MVKSPPMSCYLQEGSDPKDLFIKGVLYKRSSTNAKRFNERWFSLNFEEFQLRYFHIGKYWKVSGVSPFTFFPLWGFFLKHFFFFFFFFFCLFHWHAF
jgi:hypothetical protein